MGGGGGGGVEGGGGDGESGGGEGGGEEERRCDYDGVLYLSLALRSLKPYPKQPGTTKTACCP